MKKDFINNILLSTRSIFLFINGVLSTRFLFIFLGNENFGNFIFVESIYLFFLFFESGLISSWANQFNQNKCDKVLINSSAVAIGLAASSLLLVVIILLNCILITNSLVAGPKILYFSMGYFVLLFTKIVFAKINAYLVYREEIFEYSLINLIPGVSKLLAVLSFFIISSENFLLFFIIYCLIDILLRIFVCLRLLQKKIISWPFINFKNKLEIKSLLLNTSTDGSESLINLVTNLLLKQYAGPAILGTYYMINQFAAVVYIIISNFNISLKSRMSKLNSQNEQINLSIKSYNMFSSIAAIISLSLGCFLLCFKGPVFTFYLGRIPIKSAFFIATLFSLTIIQSKLKLLSSFSIVYGNYNDYNKITTRSLMVFFLLLILNYILPLQINEYTIICIYLTTYIYSIIPRMAYVKNLIGIVSNEIQINRMIFFGLFSILLFYIIFN